MFECEKNLIRKKESECLLTGHFGAFSKSHIIPKKLTEPGRRGAILFQHGAGLKAQKRRTSWYDRNIVTDIGEKVLSDLDDFAIKELREHRLVWSGFGPLQRIPIDIPITDVPGYEGYGAREVHLADREKLRRFANSLLWRAAVSSLPEMREVQLSEGEVRTLASHIRNGASPPLSFFPCFFTQHSEVGFIHNHTPVRERKTVFPDDATSEVEIIRFYFDGLILHFHRTDETTICHFADNPLVLGHGNRLLVSCVPWDKSRQRANLNEIAKRSLW